MESKDDIAAKLASAHLEAVPAIKVIVRLMGNESAEPIKLLEVNPETFPSGILPIAFGPDPPDVPYPSIVVEVTESEFEDIQEGRLRLPNGWELGKTLYSAAA